MTDYEAMRKLRDKIAVAIFEYHSADDLEWHDYCGGDYVCWPHREADGILTRLAHLTSRPKLGRLTHPTSSPEDK